MGIKTHLRSLRNAICRASIRLYVRPNDVFIVTYPKSGTHWIGFMLANVLAELSHSKVQLTLNNFVDLTPDITDVNRPCGVSQWLKRYKHLPSPRFFLSHALPHFSSTFPKVVYVMRDPRDVVVSYYYHQKRIVPGFDHSIEEFVHSFDSFGPCSWTDHVQGWLSRGARKNFLQVTYEQMQDDSEAVLRKVLAFASLEVSDTVIMHAVAASSLDNMQKVEEEYGYTREKGQAEIKFIRQGKSGEFKKDLSPDLVDFINHRVRDVVYQYSLNYQVGSPRTTPRE